MFRENRARTGGIHPSGYNSASFPENHPEKINVIDHLKRGGMIKLPAKSPARNASPLFKFRQSPLYKKLTIRLQSQGHIKEAENLLDHFMSGGDVDNYFRAGSGSQLLIESDSDFVYVVIATLIQAGFDRHLVEVLEKGNSVIIYLDAQVKPDTQKLRGVLSSIADIERMQDADDDPNSGYHIFQATPMERDYSSMLGGMDKKRRGGDPTAQDTQDPKVKKQEREMDRDTQPQKDTFTKKGKRVLHDDAEDCFTPRRKRKRRVKRESLVGFDEHDHGLHDRVWICGDDETGPLPGTVLDIAHYGSDAHECYYVRLDDGKIHYVHNFSVYKSKEDAQRAIDKAKAVIKRYSKKESLEESNGNNPKPRVGDIIVDKTKRESIVVKKILSNNRIQVQGTKPTSSPRILSRLVLERGLASGAMVRTKSVNESEDFESYEESACPNCSSSLEHKKEKNTLRCNNCGFFAETTDEPL